jgi:hypothetical protein
VDQGRDRRRAGHRVRQPDVERDLCALAGGADEDAQRHEGGERHAEHVGAADQRRVGGHGVEDVGVAQRAEGGEQREQADQQGEVADAVDDERLPPRLGRPALGVVEADQQVRAEADALPADEHDQEVVAHHQQQHHPHEQVEVDEVALVAGLVAHVAGGVDVDPEADEGDDEEHHRRQRVEQEGDVDRQLAGGPGVEHLLDRLRRELGDVLPEDAQRQQQGHPRHADADGGGDRARHPRPERGVQCGAGQRQDGDQPEEGQHRSTIARSTIAAG